MFWELTTVTSYLLIGFDHGSSKARRSALQALLVTGAGGLALLAGLILLAIVAGSFELSEIEAKAEAVRAHGLYLPIVVLVLLGAFTKSAQVPFHFWLPNAMAAPTPVSAYLHSATMVKAGIYLLARMHPVLSGTDVWLWTLNIFGAVTAVTASVLALRQTDLKLALAYTTLMALGTLTMFLGADATVAVAAAMTFLVVHSLYKAALFLIVGIIDHETGTREGGAVARIGTRDADHRPGGGGVGLVHGRFPALPWIHRQGAEIRGSPRRRIGASCRGDGCRGRQCVDGCGGRNRGTAALLRAPLNNPSHTP